MSVRSLNFSETTNTRKWDSDRLGTLCWGDSLMTSRYTGFSSVFSAFRMADSMGGYCPASCDIVALGRICPKLLIVGVSWFRFRMETPVSRRRVKFNMIPVCFSNSCLQLHKQLAARVAKCGMKINLSITPTITTFQKNVCNGENKI